MKCSESWLREWANPTITLPVLCEKLTMGGLEIESVEPVAPFFEGIVIGEVMSCKPHPEADRLTLCEVNISPKDPLLKIVCGAANVRVGLKTAVAKINAVLPDKKVIVATHIRNEPSEGMLCSAAELGLAEESQGLIVLPADAPIGVSVWDYFEFSDHLIDVSITPNRGDCLSIQGLAREVSALTQAPFTPPIITPVPAKHKETLTVKVTDKIGCPRYVGRIIRHVNSNVSTPIWLSERLRRSGIRSISPVVDVTNYVMLELGQPMHVFDLNTIDQHIEVRSSKQGEKITLLDESEIELNNETLVIADAKKPLAIAGVMGGLFSAVSSSTQDIFLESAFFSPKTIAKQRQHYQLHSDSAYRFERGVDFTLQREAIERATQLILEIAGGDAGPIIEEVAEKQLPQRAPIHLNKNQVSTLLGVTITDEQIKTYFSALQFHKCQKAVDDWKVSAPSYRFDIELPEDLIEEIARLYGYDHIPTHTLRADLNTHKIEGEAFDLDEVRKRFSSQGFHEIISYSFVDKKWQLLLNPEAILRELINPITAEMSVMRTNLWPGLLNTLIYNVSRQQNRIRLFEIGSCFLTQEKQVKECQKVAGVIMGSAYPEQWGMPSRAVDFYDLKAVLENVLGPDLLHFKPTTHAALHPGQTAAIYQGEQCIGVMGALHPSVIQALDISQKIFVFEIDASAFENKKQPKFQEISKFPEIRRDLALLINETIPAELIQATIKKAVGDWLKDVFIFDVYQGKGISNGLKSIALALIFQHPTRTLKDDEVTALMERVIVELKGQLGADLRS